MGKQNSQPAARRPRRGQRRYWTKCRVENGLRRAARDIWQNDPQALPTTCLLYTKAVAAHEPIATGEMRFLYPSSHRILELFESMNHAWYAVGFLVETKTRRVAYKVITPEVEEQLREIYAYGKRGGKQRSVPTVKAYARSLGVASHILQQHAAKMGIVTSKEPPWSRAELKLLDQLGYLSPVAIEQRFKRQGFQRTNISICLMRKRRQVHKGSPYFSAHAMAVLFGIDAHKITREWLVKYPAELPYVLKGTRRRGGQNGDTKLFHVDTIRRFVCAHPEQIDLRKVDKIWFLWLVTKGQVRFIEPSQRLGQRASAYRPGAAREHRKGTKPGPKKKVRTLQLIAGVPGSVVTEQEVRYGT